MSKAATKALIDEKITGNGAQAITGPILNNVLNTMVDDYGTQDEVSQLAQEVTIFEEKDTTSLTNTTGYIDASGKWIIDTAGMHKLVPVTPGKAYKVVGDGSHSTQIAILAQSTTGTNNSPVQFASGFSERIAITASQEYYFVAPGDAQTLYIRTRNSSWVTCTPYVYGSTAKNIAETVVDLSKLLNRTIADLSFDYVGGYYFPASGNTGTPVENADYFVTDFIKVPIGSTLIWAHGITNNAKVCALSVYDANKEYLTYYSSQYAGFRTITNFGSSLGVDTDYVLVRASFMLDNIRESFLLLNNDVVWAFSDITSQDLISLAEDFDLSEYLTEGCMESGTWQSYGESYLVPVSAGEVFYMKTKDSTIKTYYAFMTALPVVGSAPSYVGVHNSLLSGAWARIIVPSGAAYLYVNKRFTSATDHTPFLKKIEPGGTDANALLLGTFNSSFNQKSIEEKRAEFCAKVRGKDNIESFLFFTDPHLTPGSRYETMTELVRDKYISLLQKYYNSLPLDFCVCGGDWLNFNHTHDEACDWLGYSDAYMRKLFKNYFPLFGNHDNNPYSEGYNAESWAKALSYKTVQNLQFRENKSIYYSFDGLRTKFYMLNSGVSFIKSMTDATYPQLLDDRWGQIDWLANKLLTDDADNSIIAMHIYANAVNEEEWFENGVGYGANGIHALGANAKLLAVAYNNRESITLNGISYDFSACAGKVMFILCGHTHWDYIDTSGEIPIVCSTNLEGGHYINGNYVTSCIPTFDCCMSDLDNSAFYMTRVGVGVSRIIHYAPISVSIGNTILLESNLSGTVTWATRDSSIATVSSGTVSGVASGCVGIIATDEEGAEEYWIIKVS